uniref:GH26 domain-containing protein n=1 Tax=Loa loa TaxID=7209 RepID=A0A1I7VRY0_LOALO
MIAFIRVYQSNGNGAPDNDCIANIYNAINEGMGVEIYVEPQPCGTKSGNDQFREVYNFLTTKNIAVKTIWIKITSPITWPNNQKNNIDFINGFIVEAWARFNLKFLQKNGVITGVYTNWYDWQQITDNGQITYNQGQIPLWYWNVIGSGLDAATSPTFDDFRSFGGFSAPMVKQYAQNICFCGICTSLNVFVNKTITKTLPANMILEMANVTVGNLSWMSPIMAKSSKKQRKNKKLIEKAVNNRKKILSLVY